MSDATKELADAGLSQLINVVDLTSGAAIEGVQQLRGAVFDTAGAAVNLSDTLSEDVIEEIQDLRAKLIERLQAAKAALTTPLEALP